MRLLAASACPSMPWAQVLNRTATPRRRGGRPRWRAPGFHPKRDGGVAEGIEAAAERRALLDVEARACLRINRLARIDRHRTLADSACYLVELRPALMVDHGRQATLQWGARLVRGPVTDVARVTVIPGTTSWRSSTRARATTQRSITGAVPAG